MKKNILISSFDMAIGGVERSLIGLLNQIDYEKYDVDLMLFKHEGDFFPFIPSGPTLLPEIPLYSSFRNPIYQIAKEGHFSIAISRVMAKYIGSIYGKMKNIDEPGYLTIQYGWELTNRFLPKLNKEYDVAIGFLWPHYFVSEKVRAKKRIGWIHTDYSNIHVNKKLDARIWNKLDKIVAVSEGCSKTFLNIYPDLKEKTTVIENILSPEFIREQANAEDPKEIQKKRGKTTLVTVGRLTYAKGLDDAVRACKVLVNAGYNIEWYVVGYGPLETDLENLINELELQDRFFLLGKKTNPYPYIKACDIYVQPSRYEGKAVTIREAQILGKPVIITNFPTAKSQACDGHDAIITPLDIDSIVTAIRTLIEDKTIRDRLIANVLRMDYGNESEIQKLYNLIES
ncbi:glycosyltransferase [Bacillus canaveralius]|uniref:glycosyltransferase n=1 Tax=Bacillus canaveralius TaxID=1403243 RepID=UPI000F7B6F43|nr:glycosyltransferase [Bacillus canaveralius]RSK53483.1 glycosyltransferase [Bacillus canaveralius]